MDRPKPTKQLIIELTGNNQGLVSSAHHGLYETPLNNIYPNLDLDETVAFAASSWKSREKDLGSFAEFVQTATAYEIFSEVYRIGIPWLKKHRGVSEKFGQLHEKLNPFGGKDLKARLGSVDPEALQTLREQLQRETNIYVFESEYQDAKRMLGGDNRRIVVMGFQNAYPKRGEIVPAFAAEVSRMISNYPQHYNSLESMISPQGPRQRSLF